MIFGDVMCKPRIVCYWSCTAKSCNQFLTMVSGCRCSHYYRKQIVAFYTGAHLCTEDKFSALATKSWKLVAKFAEYSSNWRVLTEYLKLFGPFLRYCNKLGNTSQYYYKQFIGGIKLRLLSQNLYVWFLPLCYTLRFHFVRGIGDILVRPTLQPSQDFSAKVVKLLAKQGPIYIRAV